MAVGADKPLRITLTREFSVPAGRVFDAWLAPVAAGQFFFATPNGIMKRVEIDPRAGGKFVITEDRCDMPAAHFGTFEVLEPPRRIVFTFATSLAATPTTVGIEIAPVDGGCTLTLKHDIDPAWANYVDRTRQGWTMILGNLAKAVGSKQGKKPCSDMPSLFWR